jgi:hypothetical protein
MSKTNKPRTPKPAWEPGYNGHVYWLGKQKLGKVTRHAAKNARNKYTWEAGGRAGGGDDLEKAKRAVEEAVAMAGKQMDLFGQ